MILFDDDFDSRDGDDDNSNNNNKDNDNGNDDHLQRYANWITMQRLLLTDSLHHHSNHEFESLQFFKLPLSALFPTNDSPVSPRFF